jgi:hypothetical protein
MILAYLYAVSALPAVPMCCVRSGELGLLFTSHRQMDMYTGVLDYKLVDDYAVSDRHAERLPCFDGTLRAPTRLELHNVTDKKLSIFGERRCYYGDTLIVFLVQNRF